MKWTSVLCLLVLFLALALQITSTESKKKQSKISRQGKFMRILYNKTPSIYTGQRPSIVKFNQNSTRVHTIITNGFVYL